MKKRGEQQFGVQGQLFDPATTRARGPGEMSFDSWLDQPSVQFHGTFRQGDWDRGDVTHFGTMGQAVDRLHAVSNLLQGSPGRSRNYYSGESGGEDAYDYDDADPEPQTHVGKVFARRLDQAPMSPVKDAEANTAHYIHARRHGSEDWEVPGSIKDSMPADHMLGLNPYDDGSGVIYDKSRIPRNAVTAANKLQRGLAVPYQNEGEGERLSTKRPSDREWPTINASWMAPRSAISSWEGDVLSDPHASSIAKRIATHKQAQGIASEVAFPVGEGRMVNKLQFTTTDEQ